MNEAMFTILRRLLESNAQAAFCGVGDPDQVLHLPGSYRFSASLTELAGNLASKHYASFAKRETQLQPFFYAAPLECAQKIVEDAQEWQRQGRAMNQFVVLLRHPHQSVSLENFMLEQTIPYRIYPFPAYLHRPQVLMVRALLAASHPDFDRISSPITRHRLVQAVVEFAGVLMDFFESETESQDERLRIALQETPHDQTLQSTFLKRQVIAKAAPAIRRRLEAAMTRCSHSLTLMCSPKRPSAFEESMLSGSR